MKDKVEYLFLQFWYPGHLTRTFLPKSIRTVFGRNSYLISQLQMRSGEYMIGIYVYGKLQLSTSLPYWPFFNAGLYNARQEIWSTATVGHI